MDPSPQSTVPLVPMPQMVSDLRKHPSQCGALSMGEKWELLLNSQLNSSHRISPNSMSGNGCSDVESSSKEMNPILNSADNSVPSVGASSLITDANSTLGGGGQCLQRTASINNESYLHLPTSPMSFSSHNISHSGVIDGSSMTQSNSQQECSQWTQKRHAQYKGSTSAYTNQEPSYIPNLQKKARIDINNGDVFNHQVQQMIHGHDSHLLGILAPQQALQRFQHQPMLKTHLQLQDLSSQLSSHAMQSISTMPYPSECVMRSLCTRRLMQILYHQHKGQLSNNVQYWRKFVEEYFASCAKKRWCMSQYDRAGRPSLGIFSKSSVGAWKCDICGCQSGKGFESRYEALPRLMKIKYDTGVIDELLYPGMLHGFQYSSGIMTLEYRQTSQESVYAHHHVVHEGSLRITFALDLKILSWEFCARRHEEFLPRTVVSSQVNQLIQTAQKYQSCVRGTEGFEPSIPDLQANFNIFVSAGHKLTKDLELKSLNDLGFSKEYVRCLQISEVVSSMHELMDLSQKHNVGPIETLKQYSRLALQTNHHQHVDMSSQGSPFPSNFQNILSSYPNVHSQMRTNHVGRSIPNNLAQPLSHYNSLLRQNALNVNWDSLHLDRSCSAGNQTQSLPIKGSVSFVPGNMQNKIVCGSPLYALQHQSSLNIQQLLQETTAINPRRPQQSQQGQHSIGIRGEDTSNVIPRMGGISMQVSASTIPDSTGVNIPDQMRFDTMNMVYQSKGNSLSAGDSNSLVIGANDLGLPEDDVLQNLHFPELSHDIDNILSEIGTMLNNEPDNMGLCWKTQ